MKAIVYTKYGPPDVLLLKEVKKPAYPPLFDKFLLAVSLGFNVVTIWYAWNWR